MPRIKILPDQVANQIAAGEVVERPVSVVKELLENSLDSGASRIDIDFKDGGKAHMRISDNGCGMSPDDALLCLERHATSKLQNIKDLDSIASFGFRGEALPSIASVSRFTLRTRSAQDDIGCEVLVSGGKLLHRKDLSMNPGTSIEVAQLFNSVPARRKFLKTSNTEAAHITHMVRLYAISNPTVAFTLSENGREMFKSLGSSTLHDRVTSIWGAKISKDLVPFEAEEGAIKIHGLISRPTSNRATRQEMITLVNGRPIQSKALNYAISEAYHSYLPKGRFPVVFCLLEIPSNRVDVNVHPAKREVRFRDEAVVRQIVIRAIHAKLQSLHEIKEESKREQRMLDAQQVVASERVVPIIELPKPTVTPQLQPVKTETLIAEKPEIVPVEVETANVSDWRFVGYLKSQYGLFETVDGLVVMDFKRAQERIWFERIVAGLAGTPVQSQSLLIPLSIELQPLPAAALEAALRPLASSGLAIELFGRNFFRIEAIPDWLEPEKAENFVKDLAELLHNEGGLSRRAELVHDKIAHLACAKGLKWDIPQGEQKVGIVVSELLKCSNPLTCPAGHATYYETSYRELGKRFGR